MNKFIKGLALSLLISTPTLADDFNIATGSEGGGYERLGYAITGQMSKQLKRKDMDMEMSVINTNGSLENIEMFNDGEAQAAVVQADALMVSKPSTPFKSKTAHQEVVYFFVNKKNDVEDLEDIEGNTKYRIVLVQDSGADITFRNFVLEDSGYKKNYDNAIFAEDLYDAFDIVSEGTYDGSKVAGLLYVTRAGAIPREMLQDFGNKVVIGALTDSDFNDAKDENGEDLYTNCKVTRKMQAGFEIATTFSPKTICMNAKVIYNTTFGDKQTQKIIKRSITKAVR